MEKIHEELWGAPLLLRQSNSLMDYTDVGRSYLHFYLSSELSKRYTLATLLQYRIQILTANESKENV
jgi:hypothetical protein